jgi:hypothetical protein
MMLRCITPIVFSCAGLIISLNRNDSLLVLVFSVILVFSTVLMLYRMKS